MSATSPTPGFDGWDVTLLEGIHGQRGVRFAAPDHPLPDIAMEALLEGTRAVAKSKASGTKPLCDNLPAHHPACRGKRRKPAAALRSQQVPVENLAPFQNPFLQSVQRAASRVRGPSAAVAKTGRSPAELAVRAAAAQAAPGRASAARKSSGRTFATVVAELRGKGQA